MLTFRQPRCSHQQAAVGLDKIHIWIKECLKICKKHVRTIATCLSTLPSAWPPGPIFGDDNAQNPLGLRRNSRIYSSWDTANHMRFVHVGLAQPEYYISPRQGYYDYYNDVIRGAMAFPITSLMIVYSSAYSGIDQRKYESSASLAGDRWIPRANGQ